ncbi:MAG: trypsin-like peptidase domain-containing protein [Ignavibacteriae bacterium]|nr:trypsin-like peptidase domain-containing protein [Ignavibacteriota bacterium]
MKNLKYVFLSSFITLLFASIIFAYFYYEKINNSNDQNQLNLPSESRQQITENSSIIPANIRKLVDNTVTNSRENIITSTVKNVSSAIVGINVTQTRYFRDPYSFFFDRVYERQIPGVGSGAIISPDGYIITNDHVAGDADKIVVTMTDGTEYKAELVGTDQSSDIALLKINARNLPYIQFGNSDDILIGEWVIALGNPFGLFEINDKPTVTVGVVSALNMNLGLIQDRYYLKMIQTDASINSGNSGGPLVNSVGEMIGMNTIIWQENQGGSIGVGFAIPINTIKDIIEELKSNGFVNRDFWTGISIHPIDDAIAKYYKLNSTYGVIISNVDRRSPAEKAGLEVGDVILEVNGAKINNDKTILYVFHQARTNDILKLKVLRDNNTLFINIKLEPKP